MRLSEIANILEHNIQYLLPTLIKAEKVNAALKLQGLVQFRKAIAEIERTGLFKETIKQINSNIIFQSPSDSLVINYTSYTELRVSVDELHVSAHDLIKTIRSTIPKSTVK